MRLNGCLIQIAVLFFTIGGLIGAAVYTIVRNVNDSYADYFTPLPETQQWYDQTATAIVVRATERSIEYTQQAITGATELALTPEYARTPTATTSDPLWLTATGIVASATQRMVDQTGTAVASSLDPIYITATTIVQQATARSIGLTAVAGTPVPDKTTFSSERGCVWNASSTGLPLLGLQFADEIYKDNFAATLERTPIVIFTVIGEECVDRAGTIRAFLPTQTDLHVSFGLDTETTTIFISDLVKATLEILPLYPEESLPGSYVGEVKIDFISFDDGYIVQTLYFSYEQGIEVLNQGLTGEDVIEALGGFETEEL